MTFEDYLRHHFEVEGAKGLVLARTPAGTWQCSIEQRTGNRFRVEITERPVDAIWNSVVPLHLRRPPILSTLDDLSRPAPPAPPSGDLDDLLGGGAATSDSDIDDLLG